MNPEEFKNKDVFKSVRYHIHRCMKCGNEQMFYYPEHTKIFDTGYCIDFFWVCECDEINEIKIPIN